MIKRSHGYKNKLIYLDVDGYIKELRSVLKEAMKKIKDDLVEDMRDKASSLPFKDNPVRIGGVLNSDGSISGGYMTSDLERKMDLVNSIVGNLSFIEKDILELTVTAMSKDFKDSHIGLYYEHGTGDEWDGTVTPVTTHPTPNKFRNTQSIVSRSMFIDYAGVGRGRWVDLGGNIRVTSSKRAGVRDQKFINYVGEDIEALHWFSNTFKENRNKYLGIIRDAVAKVPLKKYLKLKPKFILGKD